jgi:Diguanylate cyclase, GGDEF domain
MWSFKHSRRHFGDAAGASGIVGRLGGEEFAVVLPKTDARSALLFAECVRTAFSHERHQGIPPTQQPTVSIGLAASCSEESLDALLDRADAALYRAKRGGRDRVECSVPSIGHLAVGNAVCPSGHDGPTSAFADELILVRSSIWGRGPSSKEPTLCAKILPGAVSGLSGSGTALPEICGAA